MDSSMYCKGNPYGYRLNVNHSKIKELYLRFKEWKGIPKNNPLSDAERFEFEEYILRSIPH